MMNNIQLGTAPSMLQAMKWQVIKWQWMFAMSRYLNKSAPSSPVVNSRTVFVPSDELYTLDEQLPMCHS